MAKYHALFGCRVEVQYRAGDILLPATGTLVADSGKSIFLEEKSSQRGSVKHFRWEIPYAAIISLTESHASALSAAAAAAGADEAAAKTPLVKHLKSRPGEA